MSEVKLKPKEEIIKEMYEEFKLNGWDDVANIVWTGIGLEVTFTTKKKKDLFIPSSFIVKQLSVQWKLETMRWTDEGLYYEPLEGESE